MAQIVGGQVKLDNGQLVTPSQGRWYDGQQYWGGSLSAPGVINAQSDQIGAGQAVSKEVVQQTNPANWDYIQKQQKKTGMTTPSTPTTPSTMGGGAAGLSGAGMTMSAQPTINLPEVYNNLYKNSGISEIEKDLSLKTEAYNQALSKINDNPFLSEATRVGRVQKLTTDFNNSVANIKNDIATRKADVETQLNLQTKQYDINSEAAQQALSQFNNLLSMGALDNASGEDIASITRTTGLSSSMIQNAINAKKQKDVKTEIIKFDDGTNEGFAVINSNTGEIINKQSVAASKPKAASTADTNNTPNEQIINATAAINDYIRSPEAQAAASPEDFIALLKPRYPLAWDKIMTAEDIRSITGQ